METGVQVFFQSVKGMREYERPTGAPDRMRADEIGLDDLLSPEHHLGTTPLPPSR